MILQVSPIANPSLNCKIDLKSISSPNPAAKPNAIAVTNPSKGLNFPPKSASTDRCVAFVTSRER